MLDKMRFFTYVVDSGSITEAALHFGISTSAGSRWLGSLEKELGVELYRRSNRLITLTDAGQNLYDHFSRINSELETLLSDVTHYQSMHFGKIEVVITPVLAQNYIIPILQDYMQNNQQVSFKVHITSWGLKYADKVDLIISAEAQYDDFPQQNYMLVKKELIRTPFICVAAPHYLKKYGEPTDIKQLANHRCLTASSLTGRAEWIFKEPNGETKFISVPSILEVTDTPMLHDSCLKGVGIGYLPKKFIKPCLGDKRLIPILTNYKTADWVANIYSHLPSKRTAAVDSFYHQILEHF